MKVLVTGGAGFIGSEFVRQGVKAGHKIVVVDKLTYAGDLRRLAEVQGKYSFYKTDICDKKMMDAVIKKERPGAIAHFAAESHVDRSIEDASPFLETNVKGTQVMLDCCRKFKVKRFLHVSTDEVYGEIERGSFTESSAFNPNSPYSVSKAAADMLVRAYYRTYGVPVVIVRPSNNYGPWQFPEKLIPVAINRLRAGKKIPVYARGHNVREWLYVGDCAEAIWRVLKKGRTGEAYNIGSGQEYRNIDTARMILKIMDSPANMIEFVKDRPGHDIRYSLSTAKIRRELGWKAGTRFPQGLTKTIDWYLKH
ncbi:MAG TPA: dTDP-glucose 4,6-dehydratase [Candidatus Omnitrophota bacterium]|nr:dTDP-glucose 4,6-dehydratase [Candidatus Omnitrophota bacterium]